VCVCVKRKSLSVFEKWGNSIPFILFSYRNSTWIVVRFFCCFCFFFTRFRKSLFFVFFSLFSLFSLHRPLTLRLKKTYFCHHGTFRLSLFADSLSLSLSLFSRRRGKGVRVTLESALSKAGRFSRARDKRRFSLTRLRFFCKFWGKKKPSLPPFWTSVWF